MLVLCGDIIVSGKDDNDSYDGILCPVFIDDDNEEKEFELRFNMFTFFEAIVLL